MEVRIGLDESESRCRDTIFDGLATAAQGEDALTRPIYRVDASESFSESGSLWSCLVWILIIEALLTALFLVV